MQNLPIASINGVKIQISNDAEKLVPVRQICDALGVNYKSQYDKIKDDDFLSSVVVLSTTTGSDKKEYEMVCLPLQYVFGFLFTINPKNVAAHAQEGVMKYRRECYEVLYRYFYEQTEFIQEKEQRVKECYDRVQDAKRNFRTVKNDMYAVEKELHAATHWEYHEWKAMKNQMSLEFPKNVD